MLFDGFRGLGFKVFDENTTLPSSTQTPKPTNKARLTCAGAKGGRNIPELRCLAALLDYPTGFPFGSFLV